MIDFRYHLVSIIAVFLALAIGIVVGANALKPALINELHKEVRAAQKDNHQLSLQIVRLLSISGKLGDLMSARVM